MPESRHGQEKRLSTHWGGWKVMSNGSKGFWEEWQEEKKNGHRPLLQGLDWEIRHRKGCTGGPAKAGHGVPENVLDFASIQTPNSVISCIIQLNGSSWPSAGGAQLLSPRATYSGSIIHQTARANRRIQKKKKKKQRLRPQDPNHPSLLYTG